MKATWFARASRIPWSVSIASQACEGIHARPGNARERALWEFTFPSIWNPYISAPPAYFRDFRVQFDVHARKVRLDFPRCKMACYPIRGPNGIFVDHDWLGKRNSVVIVPQVTYDVKWQRNRPRRPCFENIYLCIAEREIVSLCGGADFTSYTAGNFYLHS